MFHDELPWVDAEQKCQKEDAHLASITSDDEQTMLVQVTLRVIRHLMKKFIAANL